MTIVTVRSASRGTNYYRIDNMLHHAARNFTVKDMYIPAENHARILSGASILFMSMPHTRDHLFAIMVAKCMGIPVICDVDDLMIYDQYPDHYRDHQDCLELADTIICATDELTKYWKEKLGKDHHIVTIKNFLNLNLSYKPKKVRPTIVVRGSIARFEDYEHYKDVFIEIDDRLQPKWYFMGITPTGFNSQFQDVITWTEPMAYFMKLCDISPHFIFHPIMDTQVNRCKSMSAYHEAALCGAQLVTTASWWHGKNIIRYPVDMKIPVNAAVKDEDLIHESIKQYKNLLHVYTS
jgi:hypothetical protein